MWKEFLIGLTPDHPYVKPNAPASIEHVQEVEIKLQVILPDDIKELLLEFNGDNYFILSTQEILENNLSLRGYEEFENIDHYLLVASNGCGDYYGYEITEDGIKDESIYRWDHEESDVNCNFIKVANNLKELIELYYIGKL